MQLQTHTGCGDISHSYQRYPISVVKHIHECLYIQYGHGTYHYLAADEGLFPGLIAKQKCQYTLISTYLNIKHATIFYYDVIIAGDSS